MAALAQLLPDLIGYPAFGSDTARIHGMRMKCSGNVIASDLGRLDGFLHRHTEDYPVEKELAGPLVLLVAAHGPKDQGRPCRNANDGLRVVRGRFRGAKTLG